MKLKHLPLVLTLLSATMARAELQSSRPLWLGTEGSQSCNFSCKEIPPLSQSLLEFGLSRPKELPATLNVMVWNIYKGDKRYFEREFNRHAVEADLLILQETALNPQVKSVLEDQSDTSWKMAVSFIMDNDAPTGIATGARAQTLFAQALRSPDVEPVVGTPKPGLLTWHKMEGSSKLLLVANIHAINFRDSDMLKRHLQVFELAIREHEGPVIFAGDFNTWSGSRFDVMRKFMETLGLRAVTWETDPRTGFKLDHVWVRGLEVDRSQIIETNDGSDHPLLKLVVSLPKR